MNIAQIESNLQQLIKSFEKETFIYDLLLAYGTPKSTITRLQKGGLNLSIVEDEILWKKKLFFKPAIDENPQSLFDLVKKNDRANKHNPRFIIVTDYKTFLAFDTKTQDGLDIPILDLGKHFDFFLPWAGMEKAQHQTENPADVKAAERMAKLYDEIKNDNPIATSSIQETQEQVHNLNVFLSRLLFCFFAEDTGILEKGQFTLSIGSHTQQDGSDLHTYLDKLFEVMNTDYIKRKSVSGDELPAYLNAFPYVNGGLFRNKHTAPVFTRRSRQSVIDSGELDWSAINPDIFGSMIQAVITPEHRGGLGMHYTSVPNIMKVIEPLFLNELYEDFDASTSSALTSNQRSKKLNALLHRIRNIKIFDPACGSGNFLIIAYKELRILEMKIFKELDTLQGKLGSGKLDLGQETFSEISLSNFYGIELDDFAHEVATLSLWLAEHQMNQAFFTVFGRSKPALPLMETGNIVHGNATRVDWETVCPKKEGDEIYVLGNPPYLGARNQDEFQKQDMDVVFSTFTNYRDLDYIACWFYKGVKFIHKANSKLAFVSTNSINQGLQLNLLWPNIFSLGIEIGFAYTSFKWQNNAKHNAAVIVVIVGLENENTRPKTLFSGELEKQVNKISAYLTEGSNTLVERRSKPLSFKQEMSFGNMPNDGGGLIISIEEADKLKREYPNASKYVRKFYGAAEFIKGIERYCLWIRNKDFDEALTVPFIKQRIEISKQHRLNSKDKGTQALALRAHQFRDLKEPKKHQIIIPSVSSERREYIPTGILKKEEVVSNSAQVLYDAELYLMGIITSKMHMVWMRQVGGKLKSDYRYAKDLVYNTFPFPEINNEQKQELERNVYAVLGEREKHSEKTLAQLYDPDKMPDGLREAHHQLDLAVERCYRSKPFANDEERLEYLFKLYEQMIAEEKNKGTLFATEKKAKPKKK